MKKILLLALTLAMVASAAFAEENTDNAVNSELDGRVVVIRHPDGGHHIVIVHKTFHRTVIVHPYHPILRLTVGDWRYRAVFARTYRFREGVAFAEYQADWAEWAMLNGVNVNYWYGYGYSYDNGGLWCEEQNGFIMEPADYALLEAQYPGLRPEWIRIVPYGEDGYDSVVFVARPGMPVEYVMDYNVGFRI